MSILFSIRKQVIDTTELGAFSTISSVTINVI